MLPENVQGERSRSATMEFLLTDLRLPSSPLIPSILSLPAPVGSVVLWFSFKGEGWGNCSSHVNSPLLLLATLHDHVSERKISYARSMCLYEHTTEACSMAMWRSYKFFNISKNKKTPMKKNILFSSSWVAHSDNMMIDHIEHHTMHFCIQVQSSYISITLAE